MFGNWQFIANPDAAANRAAATHSCAAVLDAEIERIAVTCNGNANATGDERWRTAALALLGVRRLFRELMSDEDRVQRN